MENYFDLLDDPQTTGETITDVAALLNLGGFDLEKFTSNSHEIFPSIYHPKS